MRLILASASPRRREILTTAGFEFEIVKSDYAEEKTSASPKELCLNNAIGKAREVYDKLNRVDALVLGADTIVVFENKVIGKPTSAENAKEILSMLSGNTHTVITAYCIAYGGKIISNCVTSTVTFNELSSEDIDIYVSSGKPMDKAGAYGIQDGYNIVKSYTGSLNNIIGLPIENFAKELQRILAND